MINKTLITLALAFCLVFLANYAEAATIFTDGFEDGFSNWTGNDNNWTTKGTSSETGIHSGLKRAQAAGVASDHVLLKNVSTSGVESIRVEFWYRIYRGLEGEDHIYVEWTADGSNWNMLHDFNLIGDSAIWEFISYNLPIEANDKDNFGIRFRATLGAASSDIFYLDDVTISGDGSGSESQPTPTPLPNDTPTPTPAVTATPPVSPTPAPAVNIIPSSSPSSTPKPSNSKASVPSPSNSPTPSAAFSATQTPVPSSTIGQIVKASEKPNPIISAPGISFDPKNDFSLQSEDQSGMEEKDNYQTASILGFAKNKFFWLISLMTIAVAFSLKKPTKPKKP